MRTFSKETVQFCTALITAKIFKMEKIKCLIVRGLKQSYIKAKYKGRRTVPNKDQDREELEQIGHGETVPYFFF